MNKLTKKQFTQIPKAISCFTFINRCGGVSKRVGITGTAQKLLIHLIDICGNDLSQPCFKTQEALARELLRGEGSICDAKRQLQLICEQTGKPIIRIEKRKCFKYDKQSNKRVGSYYKDYIWIEDPKNFWERSIEFTERMKLDPGSCFLKRGVIEESEIVHNSDNKCHSRSETDPAPPHSRSETDPAPRDQGSVFEPVNYTETPCFTEQYSHGAGAPNCSFKNEGPLLDSTEEAFIAKGDDDIVAAFQEQMEFLAKEPKKHIPKSNESEKARLYRVMSQLGVGPTYIRNIEKHNYYEEEIELAIKYSIYQNKVKGVRCFGNHITSSLKNQYYLKNSKFKASEVPLW